MNISKPTDLILSNEITKIIPYSHNHIRRLEAQGDFPKRIRMGANRIAWLRKEVKIGFRSVSVSDQGLLYEKL